jgi:hypothetical protein
MYEEYLPNSQYIKYLNDVSDSIQAPERKKYSDETRQSVEDFDNEIFEIMEIDHFE